jgi:phage terminase large subunit-like protein
VRSEGTEEFKGVKTVVLEDGTVRVELERIEAHIDGDKLRIQQKFKADGVEVEREMAFYRDRSGVRGRMGARDVEGGLEADRRRLEAYCKAVGLEPWYDEERPRQLYFTRKDLETLIRFTPVAEVMGRWLSQGQSDRRA